MNLAGLWEQLVEAVCRPPRDVYAEADLVGGRRASFRLYDRRYYRQDVTLENVRGQKLQCSHYRPCVTTSADGRLPCVVYCHCNSGSRRDAEEILYHMLPKGITVFAFDFAGSGLSDGGFVTLGALEVDDLAAVVRYLRDEGSTSTIGLWGRSMGAVTALLYSQRDPSVAGMVLDSPFSRLVDLMMELAVAEQLRIPRPLLKVALSMLKRSVRKRAGFSVDDVAPLDAVGACHIPALFGHAAEDTFVNKHHSERLFQSYAGDKNYTTFEGDHNSVRPDFFYDSALIFLLQALRVSELVGPALDLAAAPPELLPHLSGPVNSIYVTASRRNLAARDAPPGGDTGGGGGGAGDGGGAGAGDGGSGAESDDSGPLGRPVSPAELGRSRSRALSPPWALQGLRSGRRPSEQLAALAQHEGGGAQGGADLAAGLGDLRFSEEEALQLALEASLRDARPQPGGDASAGGEAPAAAPPEQPLAQGLAAQGQQGQQAPQGPQAGMDRRLEDAPHSVDEEQAMLQAAIAASLEAAGPGGAGGEPAAAAGGPQTGELADTAVPEACASSAAAQAAADAHAGSEAAAVRPAALALQHALGDAAAAATGNGEGRGAQ